MNTNGLWAVVAVCLLSLGVLSEISVAQSTDSAPPDNNAADPPISVMPLIGVSIGYLNTAPFLYGEPVILVVRAHNYGSQDIEGFMSLEGGWANKQFLDFRITSDKNKSFMYAPGSSNWDRRGEGGELIVLPAGGEVLGEFNISVYSSDFTPGRYTISAEYRNCGFEKLGGKSFKEAGYPDRFPSLNEVQIEVVLPYGDEFDALVTLGDGKPVWPLIDDGSVSARQLANINTLVGTFPRSRYTPYAAYYAGSSLFNQGLYLEAKPLLEKAASRSTPLQDNAFLLLARSHRLEGDLPGARKVLEHILWNFPGGAQAAAARRELESLRSEEKQASPPEGAATVAPDGAAAGVPSSSADSTVQPAPNETETRQDASRENGSRKEPATAPGKTLRGDPNRLAIPSASNAFSLFPLITSAVSLLAGYLLGRYRRNSRRTG
ncbi:MAG: hypothetical protein HY719_00640 [Planctomycetes bacterium]|nr:hypothetical protein [Planctomycetota bacterium]